MVELSKKISSLVGKTNAEYELIKEGDKVLIGFSGGKDSWTLLHTLNRMKKVARYNFDFKAHRGILTSSLNIHYTLLDIRYLLMLQVGQIDIELKQTSN